MEGTSVFGSLLLLLLISCSYFSLTDAYNHHLHQHNENITIKWDVLSWTPDGYVALVTIYNYQKNRTIEAPGWELGWAWAGHEFIQSIDGAQITDDQQGTKTNCSNHKNLIPAASCSKHPKIVDLKSKTTPLSQNISNCCKGGVLGSWSNGPANSSTSAFQMTIGHAATNNRTIRLPRNCTFEAPGAWYTCGPFHIVQRSRFVTEDKRRTTQAQVTWNSTCLYSGARARAPAPAPSPTNNPSMVSNLASCSLGCPPSLFLLGLFLVSLTS